MDNKVNLAVVGAFVVALALAMVSATLWLAAGRFSRQAYDVYETYIGESVSGLTVNAAVRYRGVDVGRVRAIALAPGNVELVQVTLEIQRGTPVKVDTVATLQTQGLTGIAFVELGGGHRDAAALQAVPGEPAPLIAWRPSLLERVETAAPALMTSAARVGDSLNEVLDETNRRALRATLADLATLARTLAQRAPAIDATLLAAARTTNSAAQAGAELPRLLQRFERSADALEHMAADVSQLSSGARSTLDDANATLRVARGALDASRADVEHFTAGTLPEAHELVGELRGLTAALRRVVEEVERNPALLLQGRRAGKRGPGE